MFTEQQLKAAHARVKNGAGFPAHVQEIKGLGLIRYDFFVNDGRVLYYGENGHLVKSGPRYDALAIGAISSAAKLRHTIAIHQQGQTDFLTFCKQAAEAGVEKWVIDTQGMVCIYYDLAGAEMVAEPIPQGEYV